MTNDFEAQTPKTALNTQNSDSTVALNNKKLFDPEPYRIEAYEEFPNAKIDEPALEYRERILDWFEKYEGTILDALSISHATPTSEARKAALDDFWHITDTGTMEHFVHTHALTIEAALQQPDTSEAVRVLVGALDRTTDALLYYIQQKCVCSSDAEKHQDIRAAKDAMKHPAVIAAMKGV